MTRQTGVISNVYGEWGHILTSRSSVIHDRQIELGSGEATGKSQAQLDESGSIAADESQLTARSTMMRLSSTVISFILWCKGI